MYYKLQEYNDFNFLAIYNTLSLLFLIKGAGVFGFAIGFWTVLFFLLSVPILKALPIHSVLYLYAAMCPCVVALPLFCGTCVCVCVSTVCLRVYVCVTVRECAYVFLCVCLSVCPSVRQYSFIYLTLFFLFFTT